MRKLVSIREVKSIHPIEGADRIERASVGGWDVVVSKGDYEPGDKAIFFEIDSALPLDGVFAFMANRSPKKSVNGVVCHILKTAKLRGTISQGLLMKPEDLGVDLSEHEKDDLTEWMEEHHGVTKWEAPLPAAGRGQQSGSFPSHLIRKTDSERIQNLTSHWNEISKFAWAATEKIDGTSATYIMTEDGLVACSRNWAIKEGDNMYWRIANRYSLSEIMPVGSAMQGEIYGESINGNRLGMKDLHFAAFNTVYGLAHDLETEDLADTLIRQEITFEEYLTAFHDILARTWGRSIPRVPYLAADEEEDGRVVMMQLPNTIEEAIAQADGMKSVISPDRLAEGIVWHRHSGLRCLGGRSNFKVINNKYLLKEK